jgi:hypothetical protein
MRLAPVFAAACFFSTDHALGFAPSTLAASHQLRQAQPDHAV